MLLRCESLERPMSQLGHERPKATSALSPFDSQLRTLGRRMRSRQGVSNAVQRRCNRPLMNPK
jgi:hypothetical protein